MTSNKQTFTASGTILENLPNTMFRVKVVESENPDIISHEILCTLSGKMRINWVRLLPGDRIKCEVSKLDPTKGRVVYKIKSINMKVQASIKTRCRNCRVIKRRGTLFIICTNPKHKQRQG